MVYDPLLQYEQENHKHTKQIHKHSRIFRVFKFLSVYLFLTGTIFVTLMGFLNFSAYSAMVTNWVIPELMMSKQDDIEKALTNSNVEVSSNLTDVSDSLETITEKVALTDPDLVYSRFYDSSRLLSGISRSSSEAHFDITPYENRIIIPKLGKNIPLVDVQKRETVIKYSEMNDIFMTELKNE